MVTYSSFRDLEKKNMLDPICTVRDRQKKRLASKTMVKFCKGDPVLVTGDVNGEIDVYRLNRISASILGDESNLEANEQRQRLTRLLYPNGYMQAAPVEQGKIEGE